MYNESLITHEKKTKTKMYLHGVVVSSHRIYDDFHMAPGTGKTGKMPSFNLYL